MLALRPADLWPLRDPGLGRPALPRVRGRGTPLGTEGSLGVRANAPAIYAIIAINIVVFIVAAADERRLTDKLVMDPFLVASGRVLATVHVDVPPRAACSTSSSTCTSCIVLGPNVEQGLRHRAFVILYLSAGFFGNAVSFALPPRRAEPRCVRGGLRHGRRAARLSLQAATQTVRRRNTCASIMMSHRDQPGVRVRHRPIDRLGGPHRRPDRRGDPRRSASTAGHGAEARSPVG